MGRRKLHHIKPPPNMTAKLKTSFSCEIPRSNVASPFLFEPVEKSGASHSCLKVSHRRTPPATHITSCTKEGGTVCSKPLLFSLSPKTVANRGHHADFSCLRFPFRGCSSGRCLASSLNMSNCALVSHSDLTTLRPKSSKAIAT